MPIASYQFINILSTMKFKSLDELFSVSNGADCATKSEETLIIICIRFIETHYAILCDGNSCSGNYSSKILPTI